MKLGSVTLLEKCAAGVKLPKTGPCPECGARSNEPCPKRAVQDAERLAALETENTALRAVVVDMLSGLEYLRITDRVPYGFGIDRLEASGKAAIYIHECGGSDG